MHRNIGMTNNKTLFTIFILLLETVNSLCPFGWLKYGTSCYLFYRNANLSWEESSRYCRTQGGHLAIVESSFEKDFINGMIQNHPGHYWLGGINAHTSEGTWKWAVTGDHIATDLWYPGEPNHLFPQEECMETATKYNGLWNDEQCHIKQYCICEKQYVN